MQAYAYGLPEAVRSRVESFGRCELTSAQASALWRSKVVHSVAIPVAIIVTTKVVEHVGGSGMSLLIWSMVIAALFEEFGGDDETEAEMVSVSGTTLEHSLFHAINFVWYCPGTRARWQQRSAAV